MKSRKNSRKPVNTQLPAVLNCTCVRGFEQIQSAETPHRKEVCELHILVSTPKSTPKIIVESALLCVKCHNTVRV